MAVTFAAGSVLARLSKTVVLALTAAGEAPASLPTAGTAEQAAFAAKDLPATIVGLGALDISEEDCNVGSLRFCQHVLLHHVRALEAGGSAVLIARDRMSAVAAALYADYRLEGVSEAGDPPVERVGLTEILAGDDNPVQMVLAAGQQTKTLACVSLKIEVWWVETPDPAPLGLPNPAFPG